MVTRRAALRSIALAALVPVVSCTPEPSAPPPPDPLAELAATARADAALATAVAAAVPAVAAAATEIATARTEHAKALQAEVDRARPPDPSSSSRPPAPQEARGDAAALVAALAAAEKQAADLVPSVPRHRAGLLGSVAACCASLRVVLA